MSFLLAPVCSCCCSLLLLHSREISDPSCVYAGVIPSVCLESAPDD